MTAGTGNLGGVICSFMYPKTHAPDFAVGNLVNAGCEVGVILSILGIVFLENRKLK